MESKFTQIIRIAKLIDLDTVNEYWWNLVTEQKEFDDRISDSELNKHRCTNFLRDKISQGGIYLVESINSEIIGLGSISQDQHFLQSKINVWNIADIWVRPEYRRQKVASGLISYLEKIAIENGAEEVRLTVYSKNFSANELYRNLGYSPKINTIFKSVTSN